LCIDLLKRITVVLRYRYVRCKKTSSVLLHLQQKGKLFDKIPDDKLDSQLLALRRVYLSDLEENIKESDFKPTTEFQKTRKVESETSNLANQCDEIHELSSIVIYFQTPLIEKWMLKDVKKPLKCLN
jgi:hypothetical protein